ncbi:hypothetical protein LCGC14_0653620 [marine sediment metagenome]|uniref:HNH nuclease domain-containing protein n=1 Tax=marine sediment metagenome TaxID=412755 RepID=A0A0F9RFF1_9ZZZZ
MRRRRRDSVKGRKKRLSLCRKQAWKCAICGDEMIWIPSGYEGTPEDNHATTEHVVPYANGGSFALTNLVAAHYKCNHDRHARGRSG